MLRVTEWFENFDFTCYLFDLKFEFAINHALGSRKLLHATIARNQQINQPFNKIAFQVPMPNKTFECFCLRIL